MAIEDANRGKYTSVSDYIALVSESLPISIQFRMLLHGCRSITFIYENVSFT